MLSENELLKKIKSINSWQAHGKRAPHKPLLILYALGQLQAGKKTIAYSEHLDSLKKLLTEYGPPTNPRPQYPFIRLSNDGIWQLDSTLPIDSTKDFSDRRLNEMAVHGKFPPEVEQLLQSKPEVLNRVVQYLLQNNFPESLHDDILQTVGIELETTLRKRKARDPKFREKILEAYERSCAICGYQIRRDDQIIGLEAAHIMWHVAGGPDVEQNGIAMCTMHHKLFDHGLFALKHDMILKVSKKANGGFGLKEWLLNFHNKPIRKPQSTKDYPEPSFIDWQVNEVFKGGYRE